MPLGTLQAGQVGQVRALGTSSPVLNKPNRAKGGNPVSSAANGKLSNGDWGGIKRSGKPQI